MSTGAVVFLSDAHLGAEAPEREAAREARLHRFLTALPGRASALYVIGDLFDFWFEYRTAIPRRYFHTLRVLHDVVAAGVPVTLLNGNHDFYLGRFMHESVGLTLVDGALPLELQGRRLWLHHGDGLIGGDLGYRALKKVVRHPLSIALYGLLHPDFGIPLALKVSNRSRHSRPDEPLEHERLWNEVARPRFAEGYDAVLIGHFHRAWERHEAGRDLFVLGDWIDQFTYVELEGGTLTMKRYEG